MGVSKNRCGPPKSSHFNKVFHYFHHPFWGFSPYFWKKTYRHWWISMFAGGCHELGAWVFPGMFQVVIARLGSFEELGSSLHGCPYTRWNVLVSTNCFATALKQILVFCHFVKFLIWSTLMSRYGILAIFWSHWPGLYFFFTWKELIWDDWTSGFVPISLWNPEQMCIYIYIYILYTYLYTRIWRFQHLEDESNH